MDIFTAIAKFLVDEILSKPAYLVGLMTAIGLIALGKSWGQVFGGFLKATLGFLILGAGAGVVVAALTPLGTAILGATGANGVVPTNEAIVALAQKDYGGLVAWVMFLGFLVSLVIARFTPLRYVFLTGHHIFYMATMLTVILVVAKLDPIVTVIAGAILLATIMVIMPAFSHPWMKKVTGGEAVAMGHFGSLGYIAAGMTGQLFGGNSKSTEDIKFPDSLRFLRDSMVATSLSMIIIYLIIGIAYLVRIDQATVFKAFGSTSVSNYIMALFAQALQFGVGVAVILLGVRTILAEIVPAFAGIAEKIVPNALPALDCPVAFPYAPNAVLFGFLSSFVGGLVSLALIAILFNPLLGLALILPGMVPHFFTGGAAGVFGNATGGRRGAVLGGFVNGVLITFLPAFLLQVLGALGFANTTFGDADFGWFGIVVGLVGNLGSIVGLIGLAIVVVVLIVFASWFQKKYVDSGWEPRSMGAPVTPPAQPVTKRT